MDFKESEYYLFECDFDESTVAVVTAKCRSKNPECQNELLMIFEKFRPYLIDGHPNVVGHLRDEDGYKEFNRAMVLNKNEFAEDRYTTFNIKCTIKDRWINDFCSMLKYMEKCGNDGHSAIVGFHSDGDGDFRPKFEEVEIENYLV